MTCFRLGRGGGVSWSLGLMKKISIGVSQEVQSIGVCRSPVRASGPLSAFAPRRHVPGIVVRCRSGRSHPPVTLSPCHLIRTESPHRYHPEEHPPPIAFSGPKSPFSSPVRPGLRMKRFCGRRIVAVGHDLRKMRKAPTRSGPRPAVMVTAGRTRGDSFDEAEDRDDSALRRLRKSTDERPAWSSGSRSASRGCLPPSGRR
jgi:hypothetical protein